MAAPDPAPPTIASLQARVELLQNQLSQSTLVMLAISAAVGNAGTLANTLPAVKAVVVERDNLRVRVSGGMKVIPKVELLAEVGRRMH